MATVSRGVKSAGGTDFTDGTAAKASEVNTDFNTLYTLVNGGIDYNNISDSAAIPNAALVGIDCAKVTDHADTNSVFLTTTDAGDSGTPSLPSTLEGELERLRYRIKANNGAFTNLKFLNASDNVVSAGWTEPPIRGRNLLPNPGFEVHSAGTPNAPDGWSLVGDPSTIALAAAATPSVGVDKRSLNMVADAASEGISRTVTGLKASTKYLVGMAYTLAASSQVNLVTTGGLGTGTLYQDLDLPDSSASSGVEILQGIVMTDGTPADITVSIVLAGSADEIDLHYVWMYELSSTAPIEAPHLPLQTATYSTADAEVTDGAGTGSWTDLTDLSLEQYVPHEGYRLVYEATICWRSDAGSGVEAAHFAARIGMTIDGGSASTVEGPYAISATTSQTSGRTGGTITLRHIIENPASGSTYAFTPGLYIDDAANGAHEYIYVNPDISGLATQSQAKLYSERI